MRTQVIVVVAALLGAAAIASTRGQRSAAEHTVFTPSALRWVDSPVRAGQRSAALVGDQSKPGPYTTRVRLPPNTVLPLHWHGEERQVTILSGTLYLAYGETADPRHATKLGPGAFFVAPARSPHVEITGDEELIVQISGIGPTSTEYAK